MKIGSILAQALEPHGVRLYDHETGEQIRPEAALRSADREDSATAHGLCAVETARKEARAR